MCFLPIFFTKADFLAISTSYFNAEEKIALTVSSPFQRPDRLEEFLCLHDHEPDMGPYLSYKILLIDFSGFSTGHHHHFESKALFMCSRFMIPETSAY